jgi:hypothetical protein
MRKGRQRMANLRVGKADTKPEAPAHTPGVGQGNNPGGVDGNTGIVPTGETGAGRPSARSTARKSTGINPGSRNPIDPSSPNLPPA